MKVGFFDNVFMIWMTNVYIIDLNLCDLMCFIFKVILKNTFTQLISSFCTDKSTNHTPLSKL